MNNETAQQNSISGGMFAGPKAVQVYRAVVMAGGLRLYGRTGLRPNRAYTPSAMMRVGREILGAAADGVKARDYLGMAEALSEWARAESARIHG